MLIFDQLRISDEGSRMFINLHINEDDYFKNVYISGITIITSDKASKTSIEDLSSGYIYKTSLETAVKDLSLVLTTGDFMAVWRTDPNAIKFTKEDMSDTLFFVVVECMESLNGGVLTDSTVTKAVFDEKMLHQKVMGYTRELSKECTIPRHFIDFILLWHAFKSSIETEHYMPAIKYWNDIFGENKINSILTDKPNNTCCNNSCCCYG